MSSTVLFDMPCNGIPDVSCIFRFAAEYVSEGKSLDVLINNAGCMTDPRTLTADGLEANFATNTLGAHILTESLIPALTKSSDPR